MKRFIQTINNIFAIEELKSRIFYTLGFLVIFRLGSFIVLPGVDPTKIGSSDASGLLGLVNTFSGGAFSNISIFGLGIMPYITASIVFQLLTFALPYYQKLSKEGDSGRKKINTHTRLATIVIASFQSFGYLASYVDSNAIMPGMDTQAFLALRIITLVAGTMFCLWLGEKITDKGIGNGVSMLIMIGIISKLPAALITLFGIQSAGSGIAIIIQLLAFFFVIMAVVALTQAVRRIPIQYAKQMIGNTAVGGQRQYLPLKVIGAGVMPIIFAQSIMFVPGLLGNYVPSLQVFNTWFGDFTNWQYNVLMVFMIIIFTFFYTAITINPRQISEDLKRNNGFIPGVKPGDETSNYIDDILSKITLPGALALALIAIFPAFAALAKVNKDLAYFYGGTSLLIMVQVVLDTLQQIESYLLLKKYDGLMQSGRVKGRSETASMPI